VVFPNRGCYHHGESKSWFCSKPYEPARTTDRLDPPAGVRVHHLTKSYDAPTALRLFLVLCVRGLRDDRPLDMSGITVRQQSESRGPEMTKRESHVRKRFRFWMTMYFRPFVYIKCVMMPRRHSWPPELKQAPARALILLEDS
jgi:hypothetical protein